MSTVTLRADRVLTGERELRPGYVTTRAGLIAAVGETPPPDSGRLVDLGAQDLLPGLIDVHSDCWARRARPRPTSTLGLDHALVSLDTEVVSWGITTHYVCVALQDDVSELRSAAAAAEATATVQRLRDQLRADHRVHLRVEVTGDNIETVDSLLDTPCVRLLSYMDHTPGRGQYRDEQDWRRAYEVIGGRNLDALLRQRRARQDGADKVKAYLAEAARARHVALASHDDDSTASIRQARTFGASIAEFPVNTEAADAARDHGLYTVMGAPNAMRGQSHVAGNLSAREALIRGALGVLASDYYPPALLTAAYTLAAEGVCDLATAVALVTRNPAAALGLADRGRLAPGARADLVAVTHRGGHPVVSQTWISGRPVFGGRP